MIISSKYFAKYYDFYINYSTDHKMNETFTGKNMVQSVHKPTLLGESRTFTILSTEYHSKIYSPLWPTTFYSRQGGYVFAWVCLWVCECVSLFVNKITQKFKHRF